MGHKAEDQSQRKFVFVIKRGVSETWKVLVKSLFLCGLLVDMWGNVLSVLKVCIGGMVLGKEIQKEEDCWSSVIKKICSWQRHSLIRHTKGKSL